MIMCGYQLATYGVAGGCIDESKKLIFQFKNDVLELSPLEATLAKVNIYDPELPASFKITCQGMQSLAESVGVEEYSISVALFRERRGDIESSAETMDRYAEAEAAIAMQEADLLAEQQNYPLLPGEHNFELAGPITGEEKAALIDCLDAMAIIEQGLKILTAIGG